MDSVQFTQFADRYQRPLLSVINRMVHSWETARDIAQESFIRIWQRYRHLEDSNQSFYLLYRIAINLSVDYLRKSKEYHTDFKTIDIEDSSFFDDSDEIYHVLLQCSAKLKPKQKAAFILRDMEGFEFAEISEILRVPVKNVRSNLNLARKNIKRLLETKYNITQEFFNEL